MAKQLYKLTLKRGYPQDDHHRAGLVLRRGGTLVTELTKDQLEAVKNDSYIELSKATDGEQSQAAPVSEGAGVTSNANVGPDAPDRTASETTEADEDQSPVATQTGDSTAAGVDAADVEGATPTEPVSGEPGADSTLEEGEADQEQAPGSDAAVDQPGSTPATDSPADPSAAAEAQQTVENEAEEVTVDTLVRDNSREELNAIALKEGVTNATELDNKQQVATAILLKASLDRKLRNAGN